MEKSSKKVNSGSEVIMKVQDQLQEMILLVEESSTIAQQINIAIQQQTSASEQVVSSMREIESVSQKTAQDAKQSTSVLKDLTTQTEELNHIIGTFKINS
ncbi:MAG: hypothetical protein HQL32_18355 [Planctomycetes bacterium]|nr:hypothetical protein [Planctomycetota bacterium]